jgi:hypothetical protein
MRAEEGAHGVAEAARTVAMDDAQPAFIREQGLIQELVDAVGGLFDGRADDDEFAGGGDQGGGLTPV